MSFNLVEICNIHSLRRSQNTLDGPLPTPKKEDFRIGRSAQNVIPRKVLIQEPMGQICPELKGFVFII